MIHDEPQQEMTNMTFKVESCFTSPGRILRSLIFVFTGFGRVTPPGKICLLTSGNPPVTGTLLPSRGGE